MPLICIHYCLKRKEIVCLDYWFIITWEDCWKFFLYHAWIMLYYLYHPGSMRHFWQFFSILKIFVALYFYLLGYFYLHLWNLMRNFPTFLQLLIVVELILNFFSSILHCLRIVNDWRIFFPFFIEIKKFSSVLGWDLWEAF